MRNWLSVAGLVLYGALVLVLRQTGVIAEAVSNVVFLVLIVIAIGAGVMAARSKSTETTVDPGH